MRKTFTPLIILVISFLSFIIPVKADTYSYSVPTDLTNLTSSDFQQLVSLASSQNASRYFISYNFSSNPHYFLYRVDNVSINYNSTWGYNILPFDCRRWSISNDLTTLGSVYNCSGDNFNIFPKKYTQPKFIVLSSDVLYLPDSNNSVSYTYLDKIYTSPINNNMKLYTIYDMYEDYNTDPYPLFTSFFDIVIEKLQLVCEFFTSSYIYLSIFVVLIFYFCVLLLRRLL